MIWGVISELGSVSNCGAAALPLPLRTRGVPSGQSVRALPRANSGWGGLGAAVRSALPRVRRVAGRVRAEKRVIGHIFALGCRVVVCFGTAEYEWTGLATRARPRRALPLTGSAVGFRKSARRRWQRDSSHSQKEIARPHTPASTTFCHAGVQGGRLLPAHDLLVLVAAVLCRAGERVDGGVAAEHRRGGAGAHPILDAPEQLLQRAAQVCLHGHHKRLR